MPRKGLVFRRTQATDPVYASDIVEKFICSMMWEGKKSTAQRVFYGAMDQVAKKTNDDALKIFKKAIENVKPLLEVKTRRVGGANYQVPVKVNPFRRQSLAIRHGHASYCSWNSPAFHGPRVLGGQAVGRTSEFAEHSGMESS